MNNFAKYTVIQYFNTFHIKDNFSLNIKKKYYYYYYYYYYYNETNNSKISPKDLAKIFEDLAGPSQRSLIYMNGSVQRLSEDP